MKVLVLGGTGMLGSAVVPELIKTYGEHEVGVTARPNSLALLNWKRTFVYDPLVHNIGALPPAEYYINCIGIIKPFMKEGVQKAIRINSLLPHQLADMATKKGSKLIHITTDCVFSGRDGSYTETSPHDCLDDYGKSKSLGEPPNCMVIRTSIIGPEIHKNASFIAWAMSQRGQKVNGFVNHFWNGVTTKQYGRVVLKVMEDELYEKGTHHVFSNSLTKAELLKMINSKYGLGLDINPVVAPERIDRTLATHKPLNAILQIPSLFEQITDL
jgi:dTDP-4-dehydrorhamnose reductase